MLSGRYDRPYSLRLRPSFCLYQYLFLVHMMAMVLIVGIELELGLSLLLIAMLIRHYQLLLNQMPDRHYRSFNYHAQRGWELVNNQLLAAPVNIGRIHRFGLRWLMIHLIPVLDSGRPLVLVLCPDVLDVGEARHLKRYLLLHQKQTQDDGF